MKLNEWINRTEYMPSPEEWRIIHDVEAFYSMLLKTDAKDIVIYLFNKNGGMSGFRELSPIINTVFRYKMFIHESYLEIQTLYRQLSQCQETIKPEIRRQIDKHKLIIEENQEAFHLTCQHYRRLARLYKKHVS